MPRRASIRVRRHDAFVKELSRISALIHKASLMGYELRSGSYRKTYLRVRRRLSKSFFALQDCLSGSKSDSITQSITNKLRPIFDVGTNIELKEDACDSMGPLLEQLKQVVNESLEQDLILLNNQPYEAFRQILTRIKRARTCVMISDPYVDETIFPLYLENVSSATYIRVLTNNMYGRFKIVAMKFKKERGNFEVRQFQQLHDRHLIVDDRVWIIGQSFIAAGNKPLSIVEIQDASTAKKMLADLWNRSQKVV